MKKLRNWIADVTGIRVLPDKLLHPQDRNVETLKVPGYCQTQPHTCGFVVALMLVRYFYPDYPIELLYKRVRPDERWGVSRRRLADMLRVSGLQVGSRRNLDFAGIVKAIDAGKPIATVVHVDEDNLHWVVIYGYGRKPQRVYIAGNGLPLLGPKEYPWGMFRQHIWAEPGCGLVCGKGVPVRVCRKK